MMIKAAWWVACSCVILLSFGAYAQTSTEKSDDILGTNWITALGDYLGYGVIGLGLGVALLAVLVLISGRPNSLDAGTRFMFFALALVITGSVLDVAKTYRSSIDAERKTILAMNLPDDFWNDFLVARKQALFKTAAPTDEIVQGTLVEGEQKTASVFLPANECRFLFAATKPPGVIDLDVLSPEGVGIKPLQQRDYYRTAILCRDHDAQPGSIKINIRMLKNSGNFAFSAYVAPPDQSIMRVPPVPAAATLPELKRIVCTGQYESNCAGAHDIFMPCGAPPDPQIASQVCTALGRSKASALRTNTKGGNQCGYSMVEVTCGS